MRLIFTTIYSSPQSQKDFIFLILSLSLSLSFLLLPKMAADVSSLVRVMSGYKDDQHGSMSTDSASEKSTALITRDLLGGGSSSSSSFSPSKLVSDTQELDLDLQVPNGWEKRLDLKVR